MTDPNFLLIVTDQHRADHLGCYGNRIVSTPHIDSLAARGIVFDRCYVTNPICMPNRAAMLTGRMPSVNGVRHSGVPLPLEAVTFPELLRATGYRTALVGKAHLQTQSRREVPDPLLFPELRRGRAPPTGLERAVRSLHDGPEYHCERQELWAADEERRILLPYYGFEQVELACGHGDTIFGHYLSWARALCPEFERLRGPENALPGVATTAPQAWRTALPEEVYPTRFVEERTIAALERFAAAPGQPFLIQCSFPDPHHPFTPPGRYWDLYTSADVELPASHGHVDPGQPRLLARLRALQSDPAFVPERFCTQLVGAEAVRAAIALNYGMITMIDDSIGRVLAALDRLGLADDTVVLFTSDHGDLMGDHSLIFKQGFHYEGLIRVPFVWADPCKGSSRYEGLVSSVDIGTTILARAGLAAPLGTQGRDVFGGEPRTAVAIEEDEMAIHMGSLGPLRLWTLVDERWRMTLWYGQSRGELFDRAEDPHEMHNRWDDPAAQSVKSRLLERLVHERMRLTDTLPHATRSS